MWIPYLCPFWFMFQSQSMYSSLEHDLVLPCASASEFSSVGSVVVTNFLWFYSFLMIRCTKWFWEYGGIAAIDWNERRCTRRAGSLQWVRPSVQGPNGNSSTLGSGDQLSLISQRRADQHHLPSPTAHALRFSWEGGLLGTFWCDKNVFS